MHLKQIILACLATALANGAMAQQLTLKSGYPESYVVQKGDTLWDIFVSISLFAFVIFK